MTLPIIVREKIKLHEPILCSALLTDEEIELTLNKWIHLLHEHNIHIVFNQTPINVREQYDYLANSFFKMELPPHPTEMHFCFMYDRVTDELPGDEVDLMVHQMLEDVFKKQQTGGIPCLKKRLQFNAYENLSEPEFKYLVKSYAEKKPAISQCRIDILHKKYEGCTMMVRGNYLLGYPGQDCCDLQQGAWMVAMKKTGKVGGSITLHRRNLKKLEGAILT
ncbi:MAG: hypothetical protein ACKOBX_02100 [Bacteroidota bacterium]